ncbi:vomeronasal type-2 receptor 26-like [Lissotriton helveticus]
MSCPNHPQTAWFTEDLRIQKQMCRKLERVWRASHSEVDRNQSYSILTSYHKNIKTARKLHIALQLTQARNSSKTLYKILQSFINSKPCESLEAPSQQLCDNLALYVSQKIELIYGKIMVASNLQQKSLSLDSITPGNPMLLNNVPVISVAEVETLIHQIKSGSTSDHIPAKVIPSFTKQLAPVVQSLINLSLTEGKVPLEWKIAQVRPIRKKSKIPWTDLSNLCPISLLPFLSKLMEKYVTSHLSNFVEQTGCLDHSQSGFRPRYSTESALLAVTDNIRMSQDKGHYTILVLLDLSALFDTVSHSVLLRGLEEIPRSVCSESCRPGYRKVPKEGKPICCFACVPCAEEEFSNSTDMENCLKCPDDQWPNHMKTGCIQKNVVYLSYNDSLGVSLVSISIACSLITAGVLGIFLRHRDTPIVKANNRNISYTLLVSLILAFLCSLLFIGRPTPLTCLIQQAAFGIIFTVAVSCVLVKTITVVIAFKAIRPGSTLSRWLGNRVSASMVLLSTMGEAVICLTWLLTSPPHPDMDTHFEMGNMILQCAQGSVTAFYSVIGYMALLAFMSFIVSFLARNLPDRFNEAKLITFSMLVFCSVWVSFIPAYLSTKGRYMVSVEIFAILASSAGLLVCIFFPKCYIILLKPDVNKKEYKS